MLKRIVLALVPMAMLSTVAKADDDLTIDVSTIADAEVEIVEADLDIDVDALAADAGEDAEGDAVEACFRRFGYRHRGWGGYRWGGWGGCYNTCYSYCRPLYSYSYCRPVYHTICRPVYSYYWGCH